MRDGTIMNMFQQIKDWMEDFERSVKLAVTGEAIGHQALVDLLIEKKLITLDELKTSLGNVIKKANEANAPAAEPVTPEIVVPTAEQVAEVEKTSN